MRRDLDGSIKKNETGCKYVSSFKKIKKLVNNWLRKPIRYIFEFNYVSRSYYEPGGYKICNEIDKFLCKQQLKAETLTRCVRLGEEDSLCLERLLVLEVGLDLKRIPDWATEVFQIVKDCFVLSSFSNLFYKNCEKNQNVYTPLEAHFCSPRWAQYASRSRLWTYKLIIFWIINLLNYLPQHLLFRVEVQLRPDRNR